LGATFGWAAAWISPLSFASFFSFNFLPRITFFAGLHFNPVCLFSPTLCGIIFSLHINQVSSTMPFLILAGPFSSKNILLNDSLTFFSWRRWSVPVTSHWNSLPSHSSPFRPIFPNFRRLPAAGRLANDRSEMEFGTAHGGHNERCGCIHYGHFIDQFWLFWSVHSVPLSFLPFSCSHFSSWLFPLPNSRCRRFLHFDRCWRRNGLLYDGSRHQADIPSISYFFFQSIKSPFLLQLWSTGEWGRRKVALLHI
jgi:hypothetical protein